MVDFGREATTGRLIRVNKNTRAHAFYARDRVTARAREREVNVKKKSKIE